MRQLGEVPVCSCSPPLRELSRSGGIGRDKRYVGGHLYDARAESRSADDRVERWESVTEEIWQLEQLRRKGVLTDAEFKKAKRKVIGGL